MARARTDEPPGVRPAAPPDLTTPSGLAGRTRMVMVRLGRQLRRQDPPGLTATLYSALATIARRGAVAIGELAEAERLPSSAATRIADRLEEEGLVERRRNPQDRRGVNLAITRRGRAVLDEHWEKGNVWLAARLSQLSRPERAILAEALTILEMLVADADRETTLGDEPTGAAPR